MKKFYLYIMSLIISSSLFAQMPTITSKDNAVEFRKLQIDVKIIGNMATSTWTMTFVNNSHRTMEGNLTFPLSEGIAVDNYSIDINGRMRKAVPVEKAKATTVFEDISRRRIDPGILEKIDGNSFRTRIYPIAANGGTRTASIGFIEELPIEKKMLKMNIPLAFKNQFDEFSINISVVENALPPQIVSDEQLIFDKVGQSYNLSKTYKNHIPDKSLTVIIPKRQEIPEISIQKVGNDYFFLANVFINRQEKTKAKPKHITILWDQSLSAESREIDKEIDLLDSYFKRIQNTEVRLVSFSNNIIDDRNYTISNGNWERLKKNLKSTVYDGATNFSSLDLNKYKTDEFLLFSDGLANFIGEEINLSNTPTYTITSSPKSNFPILKSIALKSKGEFIDLNLLRPEQALNILTEQTFKFLGIKEKNNIGEIYPSLPTVVSENMMFTGRINNLNKQITLQFGFNNVIVTEQTISIEGLINNDIDIDRIWAAKKIGELDLDYDKNKSEIETLGKKYGIVTRNTSLMVLEEVRDYIRYNIDPPAELLDEYNKMKGRTPNRNEDFEQMPFNLGYLLDRLDKWYNWKPALKNKSNRFIAPVIVEDESFDNRIMDLEKTKTLGYSSSKKMETKEISKEKVSIQEEKISETIKSSTGFKAYVAGEETYLTEIEKASDSYKAYLEQRNKYKSSTKFYFDVAQFFADKKDMETAIRILSNIAELDQENYELYKGLGFKLRAMGQHHAASYVFKKVLDWRPMEPQPYRDYGLSLTEEGKLQEGLDILTEGFTRNYAANISNLFFGVQEIFFTDINGIVGKNPHLKIDDRIKKYIKPVDADVRIILSWNLADSYIDLHITDPNNELCDYRNLNTSTGGQFSTDFSGGFGPREFIQHKAVKGRYKIQTNYYGDNIQRIAGPAMVMVEIYKDFGTSKESKTIIALHPSTKRGNMVDIGELLWE